MTELLDSLATLLRGRLDGTGTVLPACRAEAFGAEVFGPAAIAELFARQPCPLSDTPHVVRAAGALAVLDTDAQGRQQAVVAELFDGRVGRLWRLGQGGTDPTAESGFAVAGDPFLTQARDPAAIRAADHPELADEAFEPLVELARSMAVFGPNDESAVQGRAFVLRAFSEGERHAALMAVTRHSFAWHTRLAAVAFRVGNNGLLHADAVWDQGK